MSATQLEQINALLRERYGCSLHELFDCLFERGLLEGYRLGKIDGRRAAKSKTGKPARRGRPPLMSESLQWLMIDHVDKRHKDMSIDIAIGEFLKIMNRGDWELRKDANLGDEKKLQLPSKPEVKRVYFRAKNKAKHHGSAVATNRDDVLRWRIAQLKTTAAKS
jgi:hypothetical protein